jgi:hypothetical protein
MPTIPIPPRAASISFLLRSVPSPCDSQATYPPLRAGNSRAPGTRISVQRRTVGSLDTAIASGCMATAWESPNSVRGPRFVREPLFDPGAELWPRGCRTDRSRRQAPSVLSIGGLPSPAADSDQMDSHGPDRANRLGRSVLSFTSNALGRRDPGGWNAVVREEWPLPGRGRSLGSACSGKTTMTASISFLARTEYCSHALGMNR